MQVSDETVYTTAEAAEYLGISFNAVKKAMYERERLKSDGKFGAQHYFKKSTLDAYRRRAHLSPEGMLTVTDAARALSVTRQTIYNKIAAGELTPDLRQHNRVFFSEDTIEAIRGK